MMKTRSRRCGAPTAAAGMQSHSASYPHAASPPMTSSNPAVRSPGTFSSKTPRGRRTLMHRSRCGHSHLSSSCAFRRPAWLTGWHGNPAAMTSTAGVSAPMLATSSHTGTSGPCFASTRWQYGSRSQNQWVLKCPVRSSPRSMPPIPANREPTVSISRLLRTAFERTAKGAVDAILFHPHFHLPLVGSDPIPPAGARARRVRRVACRHEFRGRPAGVWARRRISASDGLGGHAMRSRFACLMHSALALPWWAWHGAAFASIDPTSSSAAIRNPQAAIERLMMPSPHLLKRTATSAARPAGR
jgi:hypothetical protein